MIADGGYRGTGLVIPHRRERGRTDLPDWKEDHNRSRRKVRARTEHTSAHIYAAHGVPAVRLRYSVGGGKVRCFVEGPAMTAAVPRMPGFAEAEVRAHRAQSHIQPVRFAVTAEAEGA